jgi:beta-lactamase class A
LLGFVAGKNLGGADLSDQPDLLRLNGYKLTNPLLDIEPKRYVGVKEFGTLEDKLQNYIADQKTEGGLKQGSVYFRDLKNGPWIGINEKEPFSPASLLKLPVMLAYLKQTEQDKGLLSRQVKNEGVLIGTEAFFQQTKTLEKDKTYTIEQLIEQMITQSDNQGLSLLEKNIDNNLIDKVTLDLGIATATGQTPEDFLAVKEYASLYRVLYNSSYLNREMSEKALEILSRTVFKQGIKGGVPDDIIVAHKFGERELEDGIKQLHDCGIVYYPNHPYLLCIMTRGYDYQKLAIIIQNISRQVFEEISQRYKTP